MSLLMIILGFAAFVFVLSLPLFGRRERSFALTAFAVPALVAGVVAISMQAWTVANSQGGPTDPGLAEFAGAFVAFTADLSRVAMDWMTDRISPWAPVFALVALAGLAFMGSLLALLHRKAAERD